MKKVVSFIILVLVFSLTSCASMVSNKSEVQADKTAKEDLAWKTEVAKKLLSEFNEFYNNMGNEFVSYNRIMAADRATGLLTVYKNNITAETLKDIRNKIENVNEKYGEPNIYYGYSKSGLHFIALLPMITNNNWDFASIYNGIRQKKDESKLFWDMEVADKGIGNEKYVGDIYFEDLSNKRKTFNVKVELIQLDQPPYSVEEAKKISDKSKKILQKYKRVLELKNGIYKNKAWRLVSSKGIPYDYININVDGEKIQAYCEADKLPIYVGTDKN